MQEKQQSPSNPFYSRHNLPPVVVAPAGDKIVKVFGWDVINGKLEPVVKGERCPQEDIQAAKQETLTEMLDRMNGRTPLEKVNNAVKAGLIVQDNIGKSAKFTDLSGIPDSYVEARNLLDKGKAAVASLPDELKTGDDFETILASLGKDKIEAYLSKLNGASGTPAPKKKEGE